MTRIPLVLFLLLQFIYSQSFTGGIKISSTFSHYDNQSIVLGDSIVDDNYTVSNEVPGFKQNISINSFGTIASGNSAFILELSNDEWTPIYKYPGQGISRFTFDWNRNNFYLTLGDFYKNDIDFFIASRPIRGLKVATSFGHENDWRVELFGGIFEKSIQLDAPLRQQYKVLENGGVFQRVGGAIDVSKKWGNNFEVKIEGIWAEDNKNSISRSTVKPLRNAVFGTTVKTFFLEGKLNIGGGFWFSKLDSLPFLTVQEESVQDMTINPQARFDSLKTTSGIDNSFKLWANFNNKISKIDFELYRVGNSYFTAGNPYLLTDRFGARINGFFSVLDWLGTGVETEYFINNLNNDPLFPRSYTFRLNPKITFKYNHAELSLSYPYQNETSDTLMQDLVPTVINRKTNGPEIELTYNLGSFSASYSAYFTDVNENSVIYGDSLFSSKQNIHNLNIFYSNDRLLLSIGGSASLFDGGANTSGFKNFGFYGNMRYQLIPLKLVGEAALSWQINDVNYINIWEKIGSYGGQTANASIEYFFNPSFSFKIQFDFVRRDFTYTKEDVTNILSIDGFNYEYFTGQEDVLIFRPSLELNILF